VRAALVGSPYGLADALKKIDAVAHRIPLDANPATAHMFIMNRSHSAAMIRRFQQPPAD